MAMKSLFAAVLVVVAGAMPANATCIQSNIAGTWVAFITSTTKGDSALFGCALVIKASGNINNANCVFQSTDRPNTGLSLLTKGNMLLDNASKCTFIGRFTLGTAKSTKFGGVMSKEKTIFEGVGIAPYGYGYIKITLVKQ